MFTSKVSIRGAYNNLYTNNWPIFKYNTLMDCELEIGNSARFEKNEFNNVKVSFTEEDCSQGVMNYNNFIGCNGILVDVSSLSALSHKSVDYRYNYWGISQTEELNLKGEKINISFIYDYYDDFNKTRVDYSGWSNTPIESVGCKGDSFDLSSLNIE